MKKICILTLVILLFTLVSCNSDPKKDKPEPEETYTEEVFPTRLVSETFTKKYTKSTGLDYEGMGGFGLYSMEQGSGEMDLDNGQLVISIKRIGKQSHSIQLAFKGIAIEAATRYVISFDMKASCNRTGNVIVQQNYSPYGPYFKQEFAITTEYQHYEYDFISEATDGKCSFVFNLGLYPNDEVSQRIYVDNIILDCPDMQIISDDGNPILLNQVGYLPESKKQVSFRGVTENKFKVVNVETNEEVYEGTIGEAKKNTNSLEMVALGDFTSVKAIGRYKITVGELESYEFEISDTVYNSLFTSVVDYLYSQRCGSSVDYGSFSHNACHTDTATVYGTEDKIDITGGWHDAGDYGKYVVPGAKTVEDLLLTFELYGDIYHYGIENVNTTSLPDLLNEAAYELDWMLKMQASDGQVYHKVTSYNFPDMQTKADQDHLPMVVSPTSFTATGDFAAVMAHASRLFAEYDETRANLYKNAAIKAMDALKEMPKKEYSDPRTITTGTYKDRDLDDEYEWALIEVYKLTENESLLTEYQSLVKDRYIKGISFGWDLINGYAIKSYLTLNLGDEVTTKYQNAIETYLESYSKRIDSDYYGSPFSEKYIWGSNLSVCNTAYFYILFSDIAKDIDYKAYIQTEVDYLLGRNTCDYCFVTGFGTKSPKNPHHRPSIVAASALPGMLVGGPNNDFSNNGGDGVATSRLQGKVSPAAAYLDNAECWSLNEVTIYWNSPLILVLAGLMNE